MSPSFAMRSDVGKVRHLNEDSVLALPAQSVWVVSDGMGGHAAGDVASRTVVEHIARIPAQTAPGDLVAALRQALQDAHDNIQARAKHEIMGATVVTLAMAQGYFMCLWSGDSRLYRLQRGHLEMLTEDHSVVASLVAAGQLSWDEAEHHPHANAITHAVGVDDLRLDKIKGEVASGDRFLLCSDGLSKYTPLATLEALLAHGAPEAAVDRLVDYALRQGGADNISAIVVDVP